MSSRAEQGTEKGKGKEIKPERGKGIILGFLVYPACSFSIQSTCYSSPCPLYRIINNFVFIISYEEFDRTDNFRIRAQIFIRKHFKASKHFPRFQRSAKSYRYRYCLRSDLKLLEFLISKMENSLFV